MEGDGKDLQTKGGDRDRERVEEDEEAKSLRGGRGGNPCGSNGGTGLWAVCVSVWRGVKGKGGKIKRGECVGMRESECEREWNQEDRKHERDGKERRRWGERRADLHFEGGV